MHISKFISVVGGTILLGVLSGCVTSAASPAPDPSPALVAPYATDEEALAAAEDAYSDFVNISNEILNSGGANPERIESITVGDFAARTLSSYQDFARDGLKTVGEAHFDSAILQRYSATGGNSQIITMYVCHDVTGVDLVDGTGVSLVADDRQDRVKLEVTFDFDPVAGKLLLAQREVWAESKC